MAAKAVFIVQHYAMLLGYVVACWGLGRWVMPRETRRAVRHGLLATIAGMGLVICVLQALAVSGHLRGPWILALLAGGWFAAGLACLLRPPWHAGAFATWWATLSLSSRCSLLLLGLVFASTLIKPLAPPLGGDEVMYHLPHARAWAESGRLDIHGWLRYPWFPYNFNLPYAAALLLAGDVFTHLLGALPGWLCAVLILQVSRRCLAVPGAAIAAVLWLQASRDHYAQAGSDLGVALFVFAAYAAWLQAREGSRPAHWLALGGFFLGVACGGKYQALNFVPVLLVGLWAVDRRPGTIARVAVAFLLPCGYWYLRNALVTGDPFQPMGGPNFGLNDWNHADYRNQFADLQRQAGWPEWYLWGLLLVPAFPVLRADPAIRRVWWVCVYGIAVWLITSHYPRYLLPLFPLLCILSVAGFGAALRWLAELGEPWRVPRAPALLKAAWTAVLVTVVVLVGLSWTRGLAKVAPTPASREALLHARIPGYEVLAFLNRNPPQKIYQLGLDDAIYHVHQPLYGDVFGPWRFADFAALPPLDFACKLVAHGFDTLVCRNAAWMERQAGFATSFSPVLSSQGISVYRILPCDSEPKAKGPNP